MTPVYLHAPDPLTISGQLDLSAASRAKAHATASATARRTAEEHRRDEPRDQHGEWTSGGPRIGPLEGDALWESGAGRMPVSEDEAARIKNVWWMDNYQDTNDLLRHGTRPDWAANQPAEFKQFREDTKFFAAKIRAAEPFHHTARMYRGVSNAETVFGPPGSMVGKMVTDKGFVAASSSRHSAEFFTEAGEDPAVVTVDVPAGMRAWRADLEGMKEYTMPPNTRFKVTSDQTVAGQRQISLMVAAQPKTAR